MLLTTLSLFNMSREMAADTTSGSGGDTVVVGDEPGVMLYADDHEHMRFCDLTDFMGDDAGVAEFVLKQPPPELLGVNVDIIMYLHQVDPGMPLPRNNKASALFSKASSVNGDVFLKAQMADPGGKTVSLSIFQWNSYLEWRADPYFNKDDERRNNNEERGIFDGEVEWVRSNCIVQ